MTEPISQSDYELVKAERAKLRRDLAATEAALADETRDNTRTRPMATAAHEFCRRWLEPGKSPQHLGRVVDALNAMLDLHRQQTPGGVS